jgi:hypothetical protein
VHCGHHECAGFGEGREAVPDARRSGRGGGEGGGDRGYNDGSRLLVRLVADVLTRLLSPTWTSQILGDVGYAAGSRRLLLSIGSARMVRGQWFEYAFDRGGHVRVGRWTRGL